LVLPETLEGQPGLAPDSLHVAVARVQAQEVRRLEEGRDPQAGGEGVHGDAELGEGGRALEHVVLELVQLVHEEVELAQGREGAQQVLWQARELVAGEVEARHRRHRVESAGLDEGQAAVLALEAVDAGGPQGCQ
jgi:hypothetical protein